jgi:nucleoporin NUP159
MIALQETSSEDLGFKLSTKPEGIRIFNDTIDFLEGDKNDLNLLSIGNLTGYFACSNMSSIVLDKLSLLETGDVAEGHEIRRIENLTNVSQLTFNCDESELYVVIDGNLKVINMGQYVTSEVGSEIIKEIENIEEKYIQGVKVIHPSPGSPDSVALINNLDELILIDSGVAKALQSGVSSFCWAKNGETIYYGTSSSADVTAVSANGEVLFKILNSAVSDPSEVSLVSIVELESNSKWFAVYDRGEGEPEDHEYQIYIIEKADDHTYEFYESDIAPPFGSVTRFGTYYLLSLSNWSSGQALVFVTSSLATEVSTLFINAEGRIESVTQLNDSDRAQFPINDDTGDDASPIGLGLDLTCLESVITEPCSGIDEAKGTLPKLWCLTHEGTLISWWIFDVHGLKNGKVNLQRALDYLKQEKVGSTKPSDKKEENSINTKLLNSNASATSSSENPGQSINQPLSNTPNDKTGFGASAFGTSKIGSSSSGAAFGSTGFGSTGFGSSSSGSGTGTSTGFGSTGFGSFSKPSESFGSTGFGGSKKSSESGFGSSGFGSSGFDTTGFGSNTSESMDDNKFGNTGFGSSTASSNNFKSAGGFGKYSNNNTSSQNQSSPFSSLGNKESPFAGASRDESPFAKFGKEAQPATENKTESPFAKFGKDTSSENKTESPFAKFGKEAQPTTENKTETPFAKFGKKSDTTFNIIQSSDSSNQSVTSNEETSSETPVEGEAKPESLDLLSPLKNEINENKDKVASHVGNNEEKQGSLFKSLQRNAMGADKQSDSETSSPESSESESSDESDDIAASKPKENVSNLLESMDIKSNNEPSKSGNLHESTTRIDRTENSGISPSSGAKKQDEVDSNQQALTPPSPLEFLTFEGIQGPVKGESNIVSKKIVDVYNETCGYLIIMENNVQRLAKFIDDHNTTVDRPDHKRSLDTPDLWRLASSTDLNSIIGQVKPALSSILKSSHDLDSSLTNLTAKVEESQVQRVKIDKLLSQLSLFNKESNSLVLTKRPLDFHNESLQTSLRQKLRRVKDLENELISKMMPFKARSRTDENILKNLEKVIFQMNESAYDHLKEINSLSVELCDLKLHNESDSEMPKNNHKQQSNQASVKWILSKELKNNSNSSPRLVSLHRK